MLRATRKKAVWPYWLLASLLVLLSAPERLGGAVFLKLDDVKGESVEKGHEGEIDVLAWQWGAAAVTSILGQRALKFEAVTINKTTDQATPLLLAGCCTGKPFATAVVTFSRQTDPAEYYRVTLTNVWVTSVEMGGATGDTRGEETVGLLYEALRMDYVMIKPDGTQGPGLGWSWDLARAQGSVYTQEPPAIASLTFQTGAAQATLSWPATAGKQYQVSFGESLTAPFTVFDTYSPQTSQTISVQVPVKNGTGFFRVEELQ